MKSEPKQFSNICNSIIASAVHYLQEFKIQILEKGYVLNVFVAFSGKVEDDNVSYTKEKLNKMRNRKAETLE